MDNDLILRLIRGAGALASALAGIAALLTDGAFTKREPPPNGPWKDFPFARYEATPWGAFLLTVIIAAPAVQFVGDWFKDNNDNRTLTDIRENITGAVVNNVRKESEVQLAAARKILDDQMAIGQKTSQIADRAAHIMTGVDRVMNPLAEVQVLYTAAVPLDAPALSGYRTRLEEGLATMAASTSPGSLSESGILTRSRQGTPLLASLGRQLEPRPDEDAAHGALMCSGIRIAFFKKPRHFGGADPQDLDMNFGTDICETAAPSLFYNFETHELRIVRRMPLEPSPFPNSGAIKYVPDLAGTQVAVFLVSDRGAPKDVAEAIDAIRSRLHLLEISLSVQGRELPLKKPSDKWQVIERNMGERMKRVFFLTRIPDDFMKPENQ